jgi:hypothetical protein
LTDEELVERAEIIRTLVRPTVQENFSAQRRRRTDAVNAKKSIQPPIPVGTQVMVQDPSRTTKHQPYFFGPFTVVQQQRGGTYVLQDVDKSLFPRNPTRDQLKVIDGTVLVDDIYTAEKILGHKGPANKRFFLVKWQGYPASENTWEPEENLLTCQGLLDNYWSVRNAAQESEVKNAESENSEASLEIAPNAPNPPVLAQPASSLPPTRKGRNRNVPAKFRD